MQVLTTTLHSFRHGGPPTWASVYRSGIINAGIKIMPAGIDSHTLWYYKLTFNFLGLIAIIQSDL